MNIKYLALLATASLLSITSFAKPEAGSRIFSEVIGTPALANPCASKANPCASKADPCASKANPCASKADPCASKANPCAAKSQTVGGPLSQELQGKPVVVDVFATWCAGCKNIKPTLSQPILRTELEGNETVRAHSVVGGVGFN